MSEKCALTTNINKLCARGHRPAGPYQPIVTTAEPSVCPQCLLVNYKHFVNTRSKVTQLNHLLFEVLQTLFFDRWRIVTNDAH